MIKIEVANKDIQEVVIVGCATDLLADLSLIIDCIITEVAEGEEVDRKELLDDLTDLLKQAWDKFSKEDNQ